MARQDLAVTDITIAGVFTAETVGHTDGHMFPNNGRVFALSRNAHATLAKIFTFVTPVLYRGLAIADAAVSVPAVSTRLIGPFPTDAFNNITPDQDKVYVNFETPSDQFCTYYRM